MTTYDVIVIGAGPAGLMAAGHAAQLGAKTLLLEKMPRPGQKLILTGKGRCNLTNHAPVDEFIQHFGKNGRFLRQAFHRFFVPDLLSFFEKLEVFTITERGGRVFPASESAQDVVNALVQWIRKTGVELRLNAKVDHLIVENGRIVGLSISQIPIYANTIILSTGGASYPGTGSTGDGYKFAESLGHHIIPIRPALVPLTTAGQTAKKCQGLSLRNIQVSVWENGKKTESAFGEMLFTHFGVSGPIILTLSRKIVESLKLKRKVIISIDLKPALDEVKLDTRLQRDLSQNGKKQFQTLLKGLLPQKLIPVCVEQIGIPPEKPSHQITSLERKQLRNWLKDFRLQIVGHRSFRQAIITAGGVDTLEINPRTMASRLVDGLYFAGEVLDIDADTGGYNLQAAFSTGWLAGQSAAIYSN